MFIEALGDTAHIFETTEETFDDISFTVKPCVVRNLLLVCSPTRDDRDCAVITDRLTNGATVISFVGTDRERRCAMPQKIRQCGRIMRLAARQDEF